MFINCAGAKYVRYIDVMYFYAYVFIQPAVCTRELCVFSFYTLGVMSGAAEEVATGAEVTATQQLYNIIYIV